MPIDIITREQFESALPSGMWRGLGLVQSEYCYLLPVVRQSGEPIGIGVFIRSSIGPSGVCDPSGDDSIRCYLVDIATGKNVGGKVSKYITRLPGWRERLLSTLRLLYKMGLCVKPCPQCGKRLEPFVVKKPGANKGRTFLGHRPKYDVCKHFEWLEFGVTRKAVVA